MPLYEYECTACGHQFEVIRKFSDPPEDKCPKCGDTDCMAAACPECGSRYALLADTRIALSTHDKTKA